MSAEQAENTQTGPNEGGEEVARGGPRERSTIEFPYNDLDDAVQVAQAIARNAGPGCTLDQLAAYLNQSMNSGAFRLRTSNARIFGLTINERGEMRLTDLGRRIADESQEADARAEAFLHVPLFARVYETYRGFTLPNAAAIERFMGESGVSSKQKDKARQAFMRSARQAGFFAHGVDRLVRPAARNNPGTPPIDSHGGNADPENRNGGGGGNGGGGDDPLIAALIQKLPPKGNWPAADRAIWLKFAAMAFDMVYGRDGEIEIKAASEKQN